MNNKQIKRYSTTLVTKEIEIKTTMRDHFALIRMANYQTNKNKTNIYKYMQNLESL